MMADRIALLRADESGAVLTTVARDGSDPQPVALVPRGHMWQSPRWSPDDGWLAFYGRGLTIWDEVLWIVPARGGERRAIARAPFMRGVSWLPGQGGLLYSSSKGSTMPYPPAFNLRIVSMDGSTDTQITSGDVSYVEPDLHASGRLVVCRVRSESDIWKCPVTGSAVENTRAMTRVTRQTGQVQTPSVSPDGSELVYLSDNGGHANLWVIRTDGDRARQITFERYSGGRHRRAQMVSSGRCDCLHREPRSAAALGDPSRRPRRAETRRARDVGKLGRRRPVAVLHPERECRAIHHRESSRPLVGIPIPCSRRGQCNGADGWQGRCVLCGPRDACIRQSRLGDSAGGSGGWAIGACSAGVPAIACRSRLCISTPPCRRTGDGLPRD